MIGALGLGAHELMIVMPEARTRYDAVLAVLGGFADAGFAVPPVGFTAIRNLQPAGYITRRGEREGLGAARREPDRPGRGDLRAPEDLAHLPERGLAREVHQDRAVGEGREGQHERLVVVVGGGPVEVGPGADQRAGDGEVPVRDPHHRDVRGETGRERGDGRPGRAGLEEQGQHRCRLSESRALASPGGLLGHNPVAARTGDVANRSASSPALAWRATTGSPRAGAGPWPRQRNGVWTSPHPSSAAGPAPPGATTMRQPIRPGSPDAT